MTRHTHFMIAVAALGLMATSAAAQSGSMTAQVPFEFAVGDVSVSRGEYRLTRIDGRTDVLRMQGPIDTTLVVGRVEPKDADGPAALVFHRYGDRYFLRAVRSDGAFAVELPETREERAAADARGNLSSAAAEIVTVLARR